MWAQSGSRARRAQQSLLLIRRLNTWVSHGKIGSLFSQNVQISPAFSSENTSGFRGNGVLPRAVVPSHLPTGFRYLSTDPQRSSESRDEDLSELDAKDIYELKDFKDGFEVEISSQAEPESKRRKSVALLFKEAIGLDDKSESKRLELEMEDLSGLPPEEQVKKMKSKLESQWGLINTLKDTVDDLNNTLTELNKKNALLENANDQIAESFLEFKRSLKGEIDSIIKELAIPKENVKSERKKKNLKKEKIESAKNEQRMPIMKKKAEKDSGSLEHLWPEWIQFVEHLNERGYLSKAVYFEDGPVDLQGHTTGELYRFITLAATRFAKDHAEISKLLSRSDLKKVAHFCCPSLEGQVIAAVRRLRSLISSEEYIDCAPSDLEDTCNTQSVKQVSLIDVVRLLCAYSLEAEKSEVPIPDDVKQSVVNLLEEIVDLSTSDLSTSFVKDGQGLSLEE